MMSYLTFLTIDPVFERSLDLLPKLASGRMQDAMTWLHTDPEAEAKRKEAREARKAAGVVPAPDNSTRGQAPAGTQFPKEES
jgi:hypothetical protein